MTRLTLHTPGSAPAASRPWIEKAVAHNGDLPKLIGVPANAPAALGACSAVGDINADASLDPSEREVVQITAARLNGCDFCVAGHGALALKKAGLHVPQVVASQRGDTTGEPRFGGLAAFVAALITRRGAVADTELRDFLAAGRSEAQALEVVLGGAPGQRALRPDEPQRRHHGHGAP